MKVTDEMIAKEIEQLTKAVTTIATEGVTIATRATEALNTVLSDEKMNTVISDAVRAAAASYANLVGAVVNASVKFSDEIENTGSILKDSATNFALRHPLKALKIKNAGSDIEAAFSRIKAVFNNPPSSEPVKEETYEDQSTTAFKTAIEEEIEFQAIEALSHTFFDVISIQRIAIALKLDWYGSEMAKMCQLRHCRDWDTPMSVTKKQAARIISILRTENRIPSIEEIFSSTSSTV